MKKNKTLSIVALALWAFLDLILLIFVLPVGIILLIILLIVFFSVRKAKKESAYLAEQGVPSNHETTTGYGTPLNNPILFWTDSDALHLCESHPKIKGGDLTKITIPKENIIAFTTTGQLITQTNVSGGGTSVGGALVGGALAGAPGAVIGGRKKIKTSTTTTDKRKTILNFTEDGTERSIQCGYELYEPLCMFCLEKKI